jgi:predicted RNase H-like nuclease (RuvC/YqgF family)
MITDQNHLSDSSEIRVLKKQLEEYHLQYSTLERKVKRLERDVKSLKVELEDLDECVNRETVVDLIYEIIPILINENSKGSSYSSESSKESDLVEIVEVREKK